MEAIGEDSGGNMHTIPFALMKRSHGWLVAQPTVFTISEKFNSVTFNQGKRLLLDSIHSQCVSWPLLE